MIVIVFRFLKRLALLLPALLVAVVSIFNIFPLLNTRLPLVVAILITYVLGAYVLIPAVIRLVRVLLPPKHLPHYCITGDGFASDPVNIGIIATREEVVEAMAKAGWKTADNLNAKSVSRMILSTIYKWDYPNAPMSPLYLFGRKQDLAFQLPSSAGKGTESRHHVRFWAATFQEDKELSVRSINWQHRQAHIRDDRLLWLGAASHDIGITFTRHSVQFTHLVDPDTDAERDLLVRNLLDATKLVLHRVVTLGEPYKLLNIHALRGHVKTDGKMKVLELPTKVRRASSSQGLSKRTRRPRSKSQLAQS